MIKRTIEVSGLDTALALKNRQLVVQRDGEKVGTVPIEDIGVLIIDTPTATYTHGTLTALVEAGGVAVLCGPNHHPVSMVLPIEGHHLQSERLRHQVEASLPLRKQLWQQIVQAKIRHQAETLEKPDDRNRLLAIAKGVKSGDSGNDEARAAQLYWPRWLGEAKPFRRRREGEPPNNLLNYGYMVIRAAVARAICGAGLHPSLALRHSNRYNAFALADDLMEPWRPTVDLCVRRLHRAGESEITPDTKRNLLEVLTHTCGTGNQRGPLLLAMERMAVSLTRCFAGEAKRLTIPTIEVTPDEPREE